MNDFQHAVFGGLLGNCAKSFVFMLTELGRKSRTDKLFDEDLFLLVQLDIELVHQ